MYLQKRKKEKRKLEKVKLKGRKNTHPTYTQTII